VVVVTPAEISLVLSVIFCQRLDSFVAWLSCKNCFGLNASFFFFFLRKVTLSFTSKAEKTVLRPILPLR